MPGPFDWNGNGSSDAFDHFMDMTVMDEVNSGDDESSDYDDFDSDDSGVDYTPPSSYSGSWYSSSSNTAERAKSGMSFQDELKQNMRSPEAVRRENQERENNAMMTRANLTLHEIKRALVQSAKDAKYTTQNGVSTISCICRADYQWYMRRGRKDNLNEIKQDNQRFVLFRDPNLIYRSWDTFEIEPKHSAEFHQYYAALKTVAAKENISVEFVVHDFRDNEVYPFPSVIPNKVLGYYQLAIRATTRVPGVSSADTPPATTSAPQINQSYTPPAPQATPRKEESTNAQPAKQDSNGTTILKSFLAIGLCIGAFALCMSGEMGGLGMGLLLIGAAFGGYFILKK